MAKSNSQIQQSEPKKSVPRETINPNDATASSPKAMATIPRIMVVQKGNEVTYRPLCEDPHQGIELLMKAIGTEDMDFFRGTLSQLVQVLPDGVTNQAKFDYMFSIIKGIRPKNHIEAMLAVQMAAEHFTMMKCLNELGFKTVQQLDCIGGLYNKLARTFATQVDVLQRSRSGGEQKVTIQNVSVSEGSQAIISNVTQKATDASRAKAGTAPAAITDARAAPMPIVEQSEQRVPAPAKRRSRQ